MGTSTENAYMATIEKNYHVPTGASTVDPGLIFKVVATVASFGLPIVLSFVLGSLLYEQKNYEIKTIDAKVTDAVLVLRNYQETQIFTRTRSGLWQNDQVGIQSAISYGEGKFNVTLDVGMVVNE